MINISNPSKAESRIIVEGKEYRIAPGESLEVSDKVGEILLKTHEFLSKESIVKSAKKAAKKVASKVAKKEEVKEEKEEVEDKE